MLKRLDALQQVELDLVEDGGNDIELTVTPEGAEIVNNLFPDNPPGRFTLQEIKDAVLDWREVMEEEAAHQRAGNPPTPGPMALNLPNRPDDAC